MSSTSMFIREAREEAGLSLRALAERADVSYTTICRIENNRMDPTVGTLRKLLSALDEDLERVWLRVRECCLTHLSWSGR